jgi:hypothetical protein
MIPRPNILFLQKETKRRRSIHAVKQDIESFCYFCIFAPKKEGKKITHVPKEDAPLLLA